MAYNNDYDDLLKDIESSGQYWSDYDLALAKENPDAGRSIYSQKNAYANATTDEERTAANNAAELIRQQYGGYTGGKDGSGFTLSTKYAPAYTQYTSKYQSQIDGLMSQLMNRPAFSYNPTDDASYQAYSEKYRNLGNQAYRNALGQAAAMNGGQLSSYAMTAAQQAQNGYNAQMSDIIPELKQLAYSMYVDEGDQMRQNLSMLNTLDQQAYDQHLSDYDATLDNWQLNYGVDRDTIDDQRYTDELQYDRNLDRAELLASAGDFSGYKELGYSDAEIVLLQEAYAQQLAAANSGGGLYADDAGDGSFDVNSMSDSEIYQYLFDSEYTNRSENAIKAHLQSLGMSSGLAGIYASAYCDSEYFKVKNTNDFNNLSDDSNLISVPGYGEISFEDAERLEAAGYIELDTDENGRPVYKRTNMKYQPNVPVAKG